MDGDGVGVWVAEVGGIGRCASVQGGHMYWNVLECTGMYWNGKCTGMENVLEF